MIFRRLPVIGPDSAANFIEQILGNTADSITQMMEDGGSRKFGDPQQVLVLQIVGGVQAAAGQEGILDAGGQDVVISYLQVEIVQFLQQTAAYIIGKVGQMVVVYFIYGVAGLLHQLSAYVRFLCRTVLFGQCRRNSSVVFLPQFPQIGRSGIP